MGLSRTERKQLAAEAQSIAAETVAGDVAPLEDLLALNLEELVAAYAERGVEIDLDKLRSVVRQTIGTDIGVLNRGSVIDADVAARLKASIGRAVEQTARTVARDTIRQVAQGALFEADDRDAGDQWYVWVSVLDGRECRSCETRHGKVFQRDYWMGIEPGQDSTLCGGRCRCRLMPCSSPGKEHEGLKLSEMAA